MGRGASPSFTPEDAWAQAQAETLIEEVLEQARSTTTTFGGDRRSRGFVSLHGHGFADEGAAAVAELLDRGGRYGLVGGCVRVLDLSANGIGEKGGLALEAALRGGGGKRRNTSLRCLNLGGFPSPVRETAAHGRIQALLVPNALAAVASQRAMGGRCDLVRRGLGDDGATACADFLRGSSAAERILSVDLRHNEITEDGLLALEEALAANTTLRECKLAGNPGLKGAGAAVERRIQLNLLRNALEAAAAHTADGSCNLSARSFGDEGAALVARFLSTAKGAKIASVNLHGNGITDDGALELEASLEGHQNKTLAKINLSGNPVGRAVAKRIQELVSPNLLAQAAKVDRELRKREQRTKKVTRLAVRGLASLRRSGSSRTQRDPYVLPGAVALINSL